MGAREAVLKRRSGKRVILHRAREQGQKSSTSENQDKLLPARHRAAKKKQDCKEVSDGKCPNITEVRNSFSEGRHAAALMQSSDFIYRWRVRSC